MDEADLLTLMDEGEKSPAVCSCTTRCEPGAANTACEVCSTNMTECVGKASQPENEPDEDAVTEPGPEKTGGGLLAILLALALAGGGSFYYLKFMKKKPDTKGSADLDDYDYGDDEEEDGGYPDEEDGEDGHDEDTEEDDA